MKRFLFLLPMLLFACTSREQPAQVAPIDTGTVVPSSTFTPRPTATDTMTPTPTYIPYPTPTPFPIPTPFGIFGFSVSPNGEWFAWQVFTSIDPYLLVESADGNKHWKEEFEIGIREWGYGGEIKPAHWSNDGRYLYFTIAPPGNGPPGDSVVSVQRLELQTGQVVDEIPIEAGMLFGYGFALTSNRLAYADGGNGFGSSLVIRDLATGNVTWHYVSFPEYVEYRAGELTWSPDESKIVFSILDYGPNVDHEPYSIAFVDLISGERKILVWQSPLGSIDKWVDNVNVKVNVSINEPPYGSDPYLLNVETGELTLIEE